MLTEFFALAQSREKRGFSEVSKLITDNCSTAKDAKYALFSSSLQSYYGFVCKRKNMPSSAPSAVKCLCLWRQDVFAFKTHILAFLCGLGVLSELNERARDKSWLEREEPHLIPIFLVATTSGNIKPID